MAKISKKVEPLVMLPLFCALFFFIGAIMAQATTYYVATTGSDSNDGTAVGRPFLTIQKGIDSATAPGDVITVADGTYRVADSVGVVGFIRAPAGNGTAGNPITLKSTNPHGAHVVLPSRNNGNYGFYVSRPYWIIEGFDISGGSSTGMSASHTGLTIDGGDNTLVRKNAIHHIARTVCSEGDYGNAGIWFNGSTGVIIDNNAFYSIGRLRNGENGCVTTEERNDHGIYASGTSNLTIKRNVFYDTNRGWPISVFKSGGGTTTNLNIYNNTFANKAPASATYGHPAGHIDLNQTVINANIKNNISYDVSLGFVSCPSTMATNVVVEYNLSDTNIKTGACTAGVTFSNNLPATSPGFVSGGTNDFRLVPGSAAINAGTNVGIQFQGAAPDIGAYEFLVQTGDITSPVSPVGLRLQ